MQKIIVAALALAASGSAFADLLPPPNGRTTACTAFVQFAAIPQWLGTYQVSFRDGLQAESAIVRHTMTNRSSKDYSMRCYTMHGMPSTLTCTEDSTDIAKYNFSSTGGAIRLGIIDQNGYTHNLGTLPCFTR